MPGGTLLRAISPMALMSLVQIALHKLILPLGLSLRILRTAFCQLKLQTHMLLAAGLLQQNNQLILTSRVRCHWKAVIILFTLLTLVLLWAVAHM